MFQIEGWGVFDHSLTIVRQYPAGRQQSRYAIPENVTAVGYHAFCGCRGLTSIDIPNSVTSIGWKAFAGCHDLLSVMIPNSVTTIESEVFCYCENLCSVVIGNSLEEVPSHAFEGCNKLKNIILGTSVSIVYQNAFDIFGDSVVDFVCLGEVSPTCMETSLPRTDNQGVLVVPCGLEDTYRSAWVYWESEIKEDCNPYHITVMDDSNGNYIEISATSALMGTEINMMSHLAPVFLLYSLTVCNVADEMQVVPVMDNKFVMPNLNVVVKPHFSHTSIGENQSTVINIFPNPTFDRIKIEAKDLLRVRIVNTLGQCVCFSQATGNEFEYDFSGQDSGVCLIMVETADGAICKRVSLLR